MAEGTRRALRETFREEVERLDVVLGLDLIRQWGYDEFFPPV
jgi:hypothetical protein